MGTLSNVLVVEDFRVLRFKTLYKDINAIFAIFVRVKIELPQIFVICIFKCVRVYIYKIKYIRKGKSNYDNIFNELFTPMCHPMGMNNTYFKFNLTKNIRGPLCLAKHA